MKKIELKKSLLVCFQIFSLVSLFTASCTPKDSFYMRGSGIDYLRFPLIKPYYAISLAGKNIAWSIPLQNFVPLKEDFFPIEIQNIKLIAIERNVIMVYAPNNKSSSSQEKKARTYNYFVLIPDQQLEMGFLEDTDFNKFIQSYGFDDLKWVEPLILLQTYNKTGHLDWIPYCNN